MRSGALGSGKVAIVLSSIRCSGNETRLDLCPFTVWGNVPKTCQHNDDAGCWCNNPGK